MKYDQLIELAQAANPDNKEELFEDQAALIRYWRKQCEIEGATREEACVGLDRIEEVISEKLAELIFLKPEAP